MEDVESRENFDSEGSDYNKKLQEKILKASTIPKSDKEERKKFLTFSLLDEKYAVPLSVVKEIIGMSEITEVPRVPHYFKGLINLRGKIISVVDLRTKLNLSTKGVDQSKVSIIITEVNELIIGAIVDDVTEVVSFSSEQIEKNIDVESKINHSYLAGVARNINKKLILLLDLEQILDMKDIDALKKKGPGI